MTTGIERFCTLSMHGPAIPERVRVDPGGTILHESVFTPRRISGHEGIGQLFEYRIEAVTTNPAAPPMMADDDDALAPGRIRGTQVTVTIDLESVRDVQMGRVRTPALVITGAGAREISGYVAEASIVGVEADTMVYEFVLRPWGWLATLGTNSRVFSGAIAHILGEVLRPYCGEIEWRLSRAMDPRRDLIRQAWESDWDFCMRLCEEFGFVAWWEHRDDTHVLVIADYCGAWQRQGRACERLRFHTGGGHINEEHITHMEYGTAITLGKVTVHDHSYLSPRLSRTSVPYREAWTASSDGAAVGAAVGAIARYETYTRADYAQPRTRPEVRQDDTSWHEDAQHLARVKLEAARGARLRAKGRGRLRGLEAGKTFTLTHHPHGPANRDYVVLGCTLDIREAGVMSDMLREYVVDASFDLHPTSEPYRMPQVTPRPCIHGHEYAVVVGPQDTEIYVDEHNRLLIQYAWDREGKFDGRSSIWVRVALPWQGDQMGTVVHGRCGQQVLVGYLDGDPDRPVVTAFVPDRDNMPAWKLPENHALSGIVSRSLGRGATTNHLALDDTQNRQQAQLASDHAKSSLSLGYITRIEGHAGRQDARGEGFELRSDKHGVLRAALGLLMTTVARPGAQGKVKDIGETVAGLTRARDIHEGIAQQAQRHDAQDTTGDQADVVADIKRTNAELRGKPDAGRDEFPEFEAPHLTLSSAAGIQSTAAGSTHIASDEHTALTAGGHVSIAAGKSFFASVREKITLYAHKAITLITPGRIHVESRTADMRLLAQEVVEIISKGDWIRLASSKGIELKGGDSVLRISPEGIIGYTGGRFFVHAADHATGDPVSAPVDFPVTQENPGKLAAHHVLVEDGGGFAIANQPYRLTLDDGQIIEGMTNELGELQMVTSNVATFGVAEFMSQSAPGDVISVSKVAVYRDTELPPPPAPLVAAKRTAQIGGKTASTPEEGATTKALPPDFIGCDPLNFGLRTYRFLHNAKPDDDQRTFDYRSNVEYPVAKKYTATVKAALLAIKWDDLAGKSADEVGAVVIAAVQPALWAALASGPFGLPDASSESKSNQGAMPETVIVTRENAPGYGMKSDYLGGFISEFWVICINILKINRIIKNEGNFRAADVEELANTFYHEARHCQQKFWMISLFGNHQSEYIKFKNLNEYYDKTVKKTVRRFALSSPFPDDELVRVGLYRMLVFDYYWSILGNMNNPELQSCQDDRSIVEAEVCKMLNVTPEQARLMASHKTGYRSHLHEEDAFICGELVDLYWSDPDRANLRNPGTCTKDYRDAVRSIRGIGNE